MVGLAAHFPNNIGLCFVWWWQRKVTRRVTRRRKFIPVKRVAMVLNAELKDSM